MIRANCRDRFTAEDFDFVVKTLGKSSADAVSLTELLTERDTRDTILDHEKLLHAVLHGPASLSISPQFYFYILLRHVLKETALADRALCDYLASLLETFSRTARLRTPGAPEANPSGYVSDMLLALRDASPQQAFLIRAHVGNYSLFLSGIFPERVAEHSRRRGAPDVTFYEQMGRSNFGAIAHHAVARAADLGPIFTTLADGFHEARLALNRVADSLFHLEEPAPLFAA